MPAKAVSSIAMPPRAARTTPRKAVIPCIAKSTSGPANSPSPSSGGTADAPPPPVPIATATTPSPELSQSASGALTSRDNKTILLRENSPTAKSYPLVSSNPDCVLENLIPISETKVNIGDEARLNSGSSAFKVSDSSAGCENLETMSSMDDHGDGLKQKAEVATGALADGDNAVGSSSVGESGKRKVIKKRIRIVKKIVKRKVPKEVPKGSLQSNEADVGHNVGNVNQQTENNELDINRSNQMEVLNLDPAGTVSLETENSEPSYITSLEVENEGEKEIEVKLMEIEQVSNPGKETAGDENMDALEQSNNLISYSIGDRTDWKESERIANQCEHPNIVSGKKDSGGILEDQSAISGIKGAHKLQNPDEKFVENTGVGSEGGVGLSAEMEVLERKRRRRTEIFLGGLDKDTKEEDIRKVFEQVGEVTEVRLVTNSKTGKNKGFAFLQFTSAADAKKALKNFSKVEICGKQCVTQPVEGNDTIFLGNINKKWKQDDVVKLLRDAGIQKIDKVTVKADPKNFEQNRRFAFVELETARDAQIAFSKLQKSDTFVKKMNIKVEWSQPLIEPDEEEMQKVKSIYAEYLPSLWDEEKVRNVFKRFGEIESITLAKNLPSSRRKDFAFVNYTSREDALACVEGFSHGQVVDDGSKVNVKVSLALPLTRSKQLKHVSVSTGKELLKDKPKAPQTIIKVHEPGNQRTPVRNIHEDARVDSSSTTTDELIQLLRQQASSASIRAGSSDLNYHYSSPGNKRPNSALGYQSLFPDPRGVPRTRSESSHQTGNLSALARHSDVKPLRYSLQQYSGYPDESSFRSQDHPPSQIRGQAPNFGQISRRTMDGNYGEKSRRERRKEARLAKNKKKFDSWVQHQQFSKSRKSLLDSELENPKDMEKYTEVSELENPKDMEKYTEVSEQEKVSLVDSFDDVTYEDTKAPLWIGNSRTKQGKTRKLKTTFDEYLQMEMGGDLISKEKDSRLERKLAKKLKVKNGILGGVDDGISMLLEGIPSGLDSAEGKDIVDKDNALLKQHKPAKSRKESTYVDEPLNSLDKINEKHDSPKELTMTKDSKRGKRKKTKFEEFLEMEEIRSGVFSTKEDLAVEKKLAKKLKVKEGKLCEDGDEINKLFEGIPSILNSLNDAGSKGMEQGTEKNLGDIKSSRKKHRMQKSAEQEHRTDAMIAMPSGTCSPVKNDDDTDVNMEKISTAASVLGGKAKSVAPHLRSHIQNESEEYVQIRKRVRGLLNRMSESNVESITGQIYTISQPVGRSLGSQIIIDEVLASCSGGPRGNEQYAATFAAFVAGMACMVGIDFSSKLLAFLAECFEMEYLEEDNLSLRNLTLLLSYLYVFGVCTSDLIYDFLIMLSKRLTEADVSTILTILQACGMKLRGDDPVGMKNFIYSIQDRVHELKASCGNDQLNNTSKRMEFMLETICDIKNNKKRQKEDTVQHARVKKWLQKLRIDDILIRGMKWSKLLDPDKKGQWWLSGGASSMTQNIEEVASKIDQEVSQAKKMLQLAASQRMNTDARRAIFCVIMSGEDYKDAFTKLLSLDLPGKQDREIMRVLVECCLQEKIFNKYYCLLAHELCHHDKNHKFTLQYCLWDHFKELESMALMRSMHLAKFVAEMVAHFSLSLAVLKVVDFGDPLQLTAKRIMHFRMLFEAIFELSDDVVWSIFTRIAVTPEYESLRSGIEFFISKYVVGHQSSFRCKFKIARRALSNVEGTLR